MLYTIKNKITKHNVFALLAMTSLSFLTGCVTQSFENNEPIVKTQANRDEMAATRISLGLGYLKMGDMPQAKLNLEKAKHFSPNLVQVHTAFAHYYETVGENELAIESFEEALLLQADSADTLNNYGVFLCRQGDVEAAEVQLLKAIAVPSYLLVSESYENLSSCFLQNDDFDKAEMYLQKSIYHSPNRVSTLLQMVRLQYAMGDYKEAKRYLQKFERNTQRFTADSLSIAYKVYKKLGQRRTAANYGNMLVKMYPQSWEGKQYLLNELEYIPADDLAARYQRSEKQNTRYLSPSTNKRTVKLSPKSKGEVVNATSVIQTEQPSITNEVTAKSEVTMATNTDSQLVENVTSTAIGASAAVVSTTASTATNASLAAVTASTAVALTPTTDDVQSPVNVNANESTNTTRPDNQPISVLTDEPSTSDVLTSQANTAETIPAVVDSSSVEPEDIVEAETAVSVVEPTSDIVVDNSTQQALENESSHNEYPSDDFEPTSTQPVAARRDVPLPEPIIEENIEIAPSIKTETVVESTNTAKVSSIIAAESTLVETNTVADTETANTLNSEVIAEDISETELEQIEQVEDEIAEEVSIASTSSLANSDDVNDINEDESAQPLVKEEIEVANKEPDVAEEQIDDSSDDSSDESNKIALEDALHTVAPGQNLYNISVKYNVKLSALRKWNNISESNNIRIGDKLYVVDPQTVQMN